MASVPDPFTPRTPVDRAMLEDYLQGRLNPKERHVVELHMEDDPFLREAMDGLALPAALPAWSGMRSPRPGSNAWTWGLAMAGLVISGAALWVALHQARKAGPSAQAPAVHASDPVPNAAEAAVESTLQAVHKELVDLRMPTPLQLPETVAADRFKQRNLQEVEAVQRMDGQGLHLDRPVVSGTPEQERPIRNSRQLVFLHGLKLVHPDELALRGVRLPSPGVAANQSDQAAETRSDQHAVPYLEWMDQALGALERGDPKRALDDLYTVLGQYPSDVNAQFYAGLACYRLGLYPRAAGLLGQAERNTVDSFREEARWYAALTTEQMKGSAMARAALERIAQEGGFYAGQARQRLER
jgi:TolA-binding protein